MDKNFNPANNPLSYEGNAFKIGMGMDFNKHFRVNFEYIKHTYDEAAQNESTMKLPGTIGDTTYKDLNHASYIISISFPMYFFTKRRR